MSQQLTEKLTAEERQVVDFFKGFIPILQEILVDQEKKNLLDPALCSKKVINPQPLTS